MRGAPVTGSLLNGVTNVGVAVTVLAYAAAGAPFLLSTDVYWRNLPCQHVENQVRMNSSLAERDRPVDFGVESTYPHGGTWHEIAAD